MLIAQLSDPHLCPRGRLYQSILDTTPRFAEALAQVASFAPDLLILTGDLTEQGDAESYAIARDLLAGFPAQILAIPGNHDDRETFRGASPACRTFVRCPPPAPCTALPKAMSA